MPRVVSSTPRSTRMPVTSAVIDFEIDISMCGLWACMPLR